MGQQSLESHRGSPAYRYSESFKRAVVWEYEAGRLNKKQIRDKYSLGGKSRLLEWCRIYGKLAYPEKGTTIGRPMKDPQKQKIKELENALALAEARVKAYEKLIEIAEREEKISILKKGGAKQSTNSGLSNHKGEEDKNL